MEDSMTRGEREIVKQYVTDMMDLDNVQLEIKNGRVSRIVREDLGDTETILAEAWEWREAVGKGSQY